MDGAVFGFHPRRPAGDGAVPRGLATNGHALHPFSGREAIYAWGFYRSRRESARPSSQDSWLVRHHVLGRCPSEGGDGRGYSAR